MSGFSSRNALLSLVDVGKVLQFEDGKSTTRYYQIAGGRTPTSQPKTIEISRKHVESTENNNNQPSTPENTKPKYQFSADDEFITRSQAQEILMVCQAKFYDLVKMEGFPPKHPFSKRSLYSKQGIIVY